MRPAGEAIAIVLIAAIAENHVIGRDGELPWRLKSDMKHFRALTSGKPVIMGRKTFQSIGKPLAGRTTIVVSRDRSFTARGIIVTPSIDNALDIARGDACRRSADAMMIAGGADIYAQTLAYADRLEVTLVHASPDGDAHFPVIEAPVWHRVRHTAHPAGPDDSVSFDFVTYERAPR